MKIYDINSYFNLKASKKYTTSLDINDFKIYTSILSKYSNQYEVKTEIKKAKKRKNDDDVEAVSNETDDSEEDSEEEKRKKENEFVVCEDIESIFTHTKGLKKLRLFTSRILRNNPNEENRVIF